MTEPWGLGRKDGKIDCSITSWTPLPPTACSSHMWGDWEFLTKRQRFNFSAFFFSLYDHLFVWFTGLHYQNTALIGPYAKRGYSINLSAAGWPWSLTWLQDQGHARCLRGHTAIFLGGRRAHGNRVSAVAPNLIKLAEEEARPALGSVNHIANL